MLRSRSIGCWPALVIAVVAAACSPSAPAVPPAAAADPGRAAIVGAWELETRNVVRGDGRVVDDPVLGKAPIGRLFYGESGHVALQMMRIGRPQSITDPAAAAEPRNARAVLGYDAYFGTFTVDQSAGTVTHRVEGSLFPEDLGKDFVRRFRVTGDRLELSFTSAAPDGGEITRTLVFRRSR